MTDSPPPGTSPVPTTRLPVALALIGTVLAGLAVRAVTGGVVAKVGGVALYGTMIYVLVLLVRPRTRPAVAAAVAVLICWAVEFAQLTPFPAAASARSTLARLVLGSTFHAPDLLAYPAGVLLGLLLHLGYQFAIYGQFRRVLRSDRFGDKPLK